MDKQSVNEQKLEISAIYYLIKRLQPLLKNLKQTVAKEKAIRQQRFDDLNEYKTYEEAQDAFGWDLITETEFRDIVKRLETGQETIDNTDTKAGIALTALRRIISRLTSDAHNLEFELLSDDEKTKRMKAHDELVERIHQRKNSREDEKSA